MNETMVRSSLFLLLILAMAVALSEGAPKKPKKVKCKDKLYPNCYHKQLYCPDACLRTCFVDCKTCQPVCTQPPPSPPPPPKRSRKSPPPPAARLSSPPPSPTTNPAPPQPPSPPPSSEVSGAKRVRCRKRNYPNCYGMELTCPTACPEQCEVDCVTCSPVCNCNRPGAVCQDPRFIGGDGITFYFHGKRDHDFCLVSDDNLHINAHFIGKRHPNMTRDFTWVQSLGILFDQHKLFIGAQKTSTWNDAVDRLSLAFDGEPVPLPSVDGATWRSSGSSVRISRIGATNGVEIEVEGNFKIKTTIVPITEKDSMIHHYGITEEDCLAHLDVSFKFYSLSGSVDGVLGQTYAENYVSRVKMGVAMPVLGGNKEFAASSLFTADCAVARFRGRYFSNGGFRKRQEFAGLSCASGTNGRGVVCKR